MKIFQKLFIIVVVPVILAACVQVTPTLTITPSELPKATVSPTYTVSPTFTAQPTRISAYTFGVPRKYLSSQQTILKDSQQSISQWHRIEAWADYWIQCDTPPLDPALETNWDLLFDNPNDPTESFMVIESGDTFYATPLSYYGIWLDPPATTCRGDLEPAYAPLLLASGEDRILLRVKDGKFFKSTDQGLIDINIAQQGVRSPEDLDMEMFHNYPQNYEYLLAHLDEFVQSPDPVSNRAAFDKWFMDQLVPALGPASERPINIYNTGGAGGNNVWEVYTRTSTLLSEPPFFWFEHEGIVYPVPCITTENSNSKSKGGTKMTLCPALFNHPSIYSGTTALEALVSGWRINHITIIYDPVANRSDMDWGDAQALVTSVGDYQPVTDVRIKFGFGEMTAFPPK